MVCFNGAAPTGARRPPGDATKAAKAERLQRGRAHGGAETRAANASCSSNPPLQRGRAHGGAETEDDVKRLAQAMQLQRGRAHGGAET